MHKEITVNCNKCVLLTDGRCCAYCLRCSNTGYWDERRPLTTLSVEQLEMYLLYKSIRNLYSTVNVERFNRVDLVNGMTLFMFNCTRY